MNAVTRHSQDVLKNADNAIGTLDGVKDFANSVTGLGNNNAALSDEVQNMLSKYKV